MSSELERMVEKAGGERIPCIYRHKQWRMPDGSIITLSHGINKGKKANQRTFRKIKGQLKKKNK